MKVLWLADNPCSSAERNGGGTVTGGWHASLEKAVRGDVHLEIAYLSSGCREEEFEYEGVRYYSINPFSSFSYILFRLKRRFMSQRRQNALILDRAREIIGRSRPDLIHIHGSERCFGLICGPDGLYVGGDGRQIPVALSIQGLMGECVRVFFKGVSRADVARHESLGAKLRKQSSLRLYREFCRRAEVEARILPRVQNVFGRTKWDSAVTAEFNPRRRYFTVGEIMRAPFFEVQWHGLESSAWGSSVRIVSVLSTGPYKGFDNLLQTAALLKERGNIDFEWMVAGYDAGNEYVRIVEKSLGLSAASCGVRFAGRKNADELAQILSDADIFVQTSHVENSPNSLCEAMLVGLPAVATNVGGTSSILADGVEGLLVPDSDIHSMASAIEALAADHALALRLATSARSTALLRHAPATVRQQLIEAYKAIVCQ